MLSLGRPLLTVMPQKIYDKIIKDQKELLQAAPVPGFRKGVMPTFMLPRIKYAALREIIRETCLAALEENGHPPDESQSFEDMGVELPGLCDGKGDLDDVPSFCKASGWKPGDDFSFRARAVRATGSSEKAIFAPISDISRLDEAM